MMMTIIMIRDCLPHTWGVSREPYNGLCTKNAKLPTYYHRSPSLQSHKTKRKASHPPPTCFSPLQFQSLSPCVPHIRMRSSVRDSGTASIIDRELRSRLPPCQNYNLTFPCIREQASNGAFKYKGFLRTLVSIAKEEGPRYVRYSNQSYLIISITIHHIFALVSLNFIFRGLYGGLGMHLLRSVPNAAIMFATFELTSRWLQQKSDDSRLPPNPPTASGRTVPSSPTKMTSAGTARIPIKR